MLVGDCLLAKDCAGAKVGGYLLGKRAILIVLNTGGKKQSFNLELRSEAAPPELESGKTFTFF